VTDLQILDGQQLDVDQARALIDQIKVLPSGPGVLAGRDANVSSARHDLVGAGVGGGRWRMTKKEPPGRDQPTGGDSHNANTSRARR
jgi:hypothetical protein